MQVADRFVRAAPLIVGVKCSDGVLLLAAHTFDDNEPLLYYYPSGSEDDASDGGNFDDRRSSSSSTSTTTSPLSAVKPPAHGSFRDLPLHYAGPFRIQVIDPSSCLTIASTGWRADCDDLVRTARFFSAHEVSRYGPPTSGGDGGDTDHRGTVLSCDLSLYLARCAVSEDVSELKEKEKRSRAVASLSSSHSIFGDSHSQVRAKSCAGLLASPTRLWLVDSTGATPVRALCVGGGGTEAATAHASSLGEASKSDDAPRTVSDAVNQWLIQVPDWTRLDCRQALDELLIMLCDGSSIDGSAEAKTGARQPLIREGTRLEIAFVRCPKVLRQRIGE
jgi:hypothetical protein